MKKLTFRQLLTVASMLFGMFFGAGNLIFPASMGQLAGRNLWLASVGFLITGVGLPLLGVAALGISREEGLLELSGRVSKGYGLFFTCLLYLTIGPFFAIPRCATVSYTVGIQRMLPETGQTLALAVFSLVFFAAVLFFSLRPGEILTWIGKVLNPLFLVFLAVLVLRALTAPLGAVADIDPTGSYAAAALPTGLLEGYNTMDALASLAFGIIVVNAIRGLGVEEPGQVAKSTVFAGIFSSLLMAVIYLLVTVVGAQSRGQFAAASNGGEALAQIAEHYFGPAGALILAATVTIACLKTAVGLITSCGETFVKIFPHGPSYRVWAVTFCVVSFLIANLGLNAILAYSTPMLMFLYPLSIVLILLTLGGRLFGNHPTVLRWTIGCTALAALVDLLRTLPGETQAFLHLEGVVALAQSWLPLCEQGFGWVLPALIGLVIGLVLRAVRRS
ncbi:branched-chain amino acid transport system II carrier protein [Subdoligranulum variabile]|uniref:Branched-chain amino acid transport system carrier protein n=1 Tax=Subdoligranulum variabile DSM 15176 TaxID=411471 RepID=D1PIL7_9FIRM|nr:branched-chain amino acid transport system II carrier protein [Subdoligranulum variabile]EFB77376.1 branched-chain amino acid transport system II carrier protein [Subdoligranulum variabile DSM 15176]UWP67270.1 branched-chain amino acid transport system II carrier protein [Subdoligranulum variabile]